MDNEPTLNNRLEKLWGHLENMTPDQLRQHIMKVRGERRVVKVKTAVKKSARQVSDTAKTKAKKLLQGVDKDTLARMLKELDDASKG